MKKLLMMVLPGVLAFNISSSVAMDNVIDRELGNTKVTRGFTKAEEQQFLDIITECIRQETKAQNRSSQNTNEFNPRAERIEGADKIPHWVCNP